MARFCFTGHPFVDAGIAGMAALLEQNGPRFNTPEEITEVDARRASDLLCNLYANRVAKDEKFKNEASKRLPLCTHLLQEVMPGSSWDQAKGKPENQILIFNEYVQSLLNKAAASPIGFCFLTGTDAHVRIGKSAMPLLSSSSERPNCFPNLDDGYPASAWITLAVLFSPLSIEKTVKADGDGSACLIYHSENWRFMVEVARQNLRRLQTLLAANSIEGYRALRYKGKARSGTWKMALSTMLHALNRLGPTDRPQIAIWSFNASNQSCRYECVRISEAVLEIHSSRQTHTGAYREVPRCSDTVSRLLLEGRPITSASIVEKEAKKELKNVDRLTRTLLRPGWPLQSLYAERVLKMPRRLLNAVERAAEHLVNDADAVRYCLYEYGRQILPIELTGRYKLSPQWCATFADYPDLWQEYLRGAVLWKAKGHDFAKPATVMDEPGEVEALIKQVAHRLREKHGYKRLAMALSVRIPYRYRQQWIRLLADGACTWEDFLAFNPLEDALSIGRYYQTRTRRDYLIAYLLGCANAQMREPDQETDQTEEPLSDSILFQVVEEE
jgi:hypothetical protein